MSALGKGQMSQYEMAIQKRVLKMFRVFSTDGKTMKASDLGTLLRSFYLCPTETEIRELQKLLEKMENPGVLHIDAILPTLTDVIIKDRFKPADQEVIEKAFEYLDSDNKKFLSPDEIQLFFGNFGEVFSKEEMQEMMEFAADPVRRRICFQNYIPHLVIPEEAYLRGMVSTSDQVQKPKEETELVILPDNLF